MRRQKVLLGRHRYSERYGTSLHRLFTSLDDALSTYFDIVRLDPMTSYFTNEGYIGQARKFLDCDTAFLFQPRLVEAMRKSGWAGRVIVMGLGSMPRGASGIRTILPYLKESDTVLLSSRADLEIWKWLIRRGPPAKIVYFGVDTEVFRPMESEDISDLRLALGYQPEDRIILYAGRITLEKNVHSILPIFAEAVKVNSNYRLLIVGPFDHTPFYEFGNRTNIEQAFMQILKDLGIPKHTVKFIPHVDTVELVRLYNVSDLFVNLTLHHDENFGYSQVEAMSCGLPVVGTEWGGLKDTVQSGRTGYLVPTWGTEFGIRFDRVAATRHILELLEDDQSRLKFGAAGRAWVEENLSLKQFAEQILAVMEDDDRWEPRESMFTPTGLKFNLRFSKKSMEDGRLVFTPHVPTYERYDDIDYRSLINHYTSGTSVPNYIHSDSTLVRAGFWDSLTETGTGGWVFSNRDPLWPAEHWLNELEISILQHVYSHQKTKAEDIVRHHGVKALEVLHSMLGRGLLLAK